MLNHKLLGSVSSLQSDANFENVSLLLSGDGTNGAQNNTFLDSSTNNFTITRNGNTTQGSFSPYGSNWSNYFPNTSSYLAFSNLSAYSPGTGAFTLECWVYHTAAVGTEEIYCTHYPNGLQLSRDTSGKLRLAQSGVGTSLTGATTLASNTWYHVAATRSGTTAYLFVNGVLDATGTVSTNYSSTGSFSVSANPGIAGYISNFRLVNGSAVYTSAFTPSTTPLTAISGTALLTAQSNRFKDNSSNNATATINGTPSVQRFSPFEPTAPYSTSVIGGSGYFDGSGDYLTTPSTGQFNPTGDFTVSCWFNLQSFANSYYVIGGTWNTGTSDEWLIQLDNAGAIRFLTTSGTSFSSSGVVKLNCWNYFAAVRSGSTLTVYLNGASLYSYTLSGTPFTASKSIRIGMQPDGSWSWNGYISDFKLIAGSAITTVPTAPQTNTIGTSLLLSMSNAGIPDYAMMNDLETVGNAQVSTSVKKFGTGSLAFDGTGDILTMPSSPNLSMGSGNFTYEFWLYINASNTCIFDTRATNNVTTGFTLLLNNTPKLAIYTNTTNLTCSTTLATSTWYHVAVVRNGSTLTVYLNGTSDGSLTFTNNLSDSAFRVGQYIDGTGSLNGYIDDLRITKGVARYTANFTPPASAFPTY